MSEMSGFDRMSYGDPSQFAGPRASGAPAPSPTPEAVLAEHPARLVQHGQDAAMVLLAFVATLETTLTHEEALYLAAHVWRLT